MVKLNSHIYVLSAQIKNAYSANSEKIAKFNIELLYIYLYQGNKFCLEFQVVAYWSLGIASLVQAVNRFLFGEVKIDKWK